MSKPTAAVKGTAKIDLTPPKDEIYIPLPLNAPDPPGGLPLEVQKPLALSSPSSGNQRTVAMVSPIMNSAPPPPIHSEEDPTEDSILSTIKPMQPLLSRTSSPYVRHHYGLSPRIHPAAVNSPTRLVAKLDNAKIYGIPAIRKVDLSSGYLSDSAAPPRHYRYSPTPSDGPKLTALKGDDGYVSEGGEPGRRSRVRELWGKDSSSHRIFGVIHEDGAKSSPYQQALFKLGLDDSSSLSSGVSDTFPEGATDDLTSSSLSSDTNHYGSLKKSPKLPSSAGKNSKPPVKKTDSCMQTDTSVFQNNNINSTSSSAAAASWKKQQHERPKERRSNSSSAKKGGDKNKHRKAEENSFPPGKMENLEYNERRPNQSNLHGSNVSFNHHSSYRTTPNNEDLAPKTPPSALDSSASLAKKIQGSKSSSHASGGSKRSSGSGGGANSQQQSRKGPGDHHHHRKVKVCANTQTTVHDLYLSSGGVSDSESPQGRSRHGPVLRDRLHGNVLRAARLSLKSATDSDNYESIDHFSWTSKSTPRSLHGTSLAEAESIESLSSPSPSNIHAQIQHARANSLTHARLMLHQRELSASPRLSRSNSIRSTKSEKLYPSMLQRSGEGGSESQPGPPTSPTPTTMSQTVPRSVYPHHHSPFTTPRSSAAMSQYMGGLLSKLSKEDDVHGSSISLVSTTSSLYSTAEEKQAHEIRKLRRELDQANEKVATLTSQLTTNAHMVSAFEQSLSNMTSRLQHLTATAEQKDSELHELRQTIEALKKQSAEAGLTKVALQSMQTVQKSTNCGSSTNLTRRHTFNTTKDSALHEQRISRQFSTDSMSSDVERSLDILDHCKKKKKKSWLRSSFSRAFSRSKKNRNGSVSDVEDLRHFQSDSSAPNSPLLGLAHLAVNNSLSSQNLKLSHSSSALYDKDEAMGPEVVKELRQRLHEKDMELTDIRLEALTSAHQLESLKETVAKMRAELLTLKQENERLQRLLSLKSSPSQGSLPPEETSERPLSSSEQSGSPNAEAYLNEVNNASGGAGANKEGKRITVSVQLGCHGDHTKHMEENKVSEWLIGAITVCNKTKWELLDSLVKKTFKDFVLRVDPISNLGLSGESVHSYYIGDLTRSKEHPLPELLPCGYLVGDSLHIRITLRGTKQNSVEGLAFETLIPKSIVQRYVSLLTEYRRIILCGPSGTGKTFMAQRLAEYLVLRSGKEVTAGAIATFSVDHKSAKELRQYLSAIAEQCENNKASDLPTVIILDNLHHVGSLAEVFNGFLSTKYQKCPFIIGTMNQATCSTTNLQLHHNFRWVLCANHVEPVRGFLGRFLRRRLVEEEVRRSLSTATSELGRIVDWVPEVWQHLNRFLETHSSSDVTIGPRLFLSCPMDLSGSQVWFTDLWNYSIVPYLLEATREGLQMYGRRAPWEDPTEWVMESYPWPSPRPGTGEWPHQLLRLRPEDVGYEAHSSPGPLSKHSSNGPSGNDIEADPLLSMLMRLQEAASYTSPLSNDLDATGHNVHTEDLAIESNI